jgi:hypothetical protein
MKKSINKIKFFIFLITISVHALGNDRSDSLESIYQRVTQLENYKNNVQILYEASEKELSTQVNRELDSAKTEIKELSKKYDILIQYGIPGTAVALIFLIWGGKKYVRKKIETEISSIVNQGREDIISLIHEHQIENKIRKENKIIVLSLSDKEEREIRKFFKDLKFNLSNLTFKIDNQFHSYTKGSLVVFNMLEPSIIKGYLRNAKDDDMFVAYTTQKLDNDLRLNYSNSPFTLYTRIIETIKYKNHLAS